MLRSVVPSSLEKNLSTIWSLADECLWGTRLCESVSLDGNIPLGRDVALIRKARWKTGKQQRWKWRPQACLRIVCEVPKEHILAGGRWTVWHGTARHGAFPPHVDWQQKPTQAYYMTVDPWPPAVLLHTISAPNKRREPGWVNPPTLAWSPDEEEHLRAAWQGDAIRTTDVPDLHPAPVTHARPAATLAVAQRGQQNPQLVVCMFSPADAHIAVCDPERLPGPEAVIRVADCARMIIKALREGEHHALLLQVHLKDNAKAAKPGLWPAAARPADLDLQLAVPTAVYHWLQAFHDLRWRGKPDRQIRATHWQEWLQADAQRDAVQSLRPAPVTREKFVVFSALCFCFSCCLLLL